jgi:hypothetical protein
MTTPGPLKIEDGKVVECLRDFFQSKETNNFRSRILLDISNIFSMYALK